MTVTAPQTQHRVVALGVAEDLRWSKRSVVVVDGRELLVLCVRRRFTVVENRCPHLGLPLDDGRVVGRTLVCSGHGYKYALDDGARIPGWRCSPSPRERLTLVSCRVDDGVLYAELPAS
jgi:nitrite reductase/ring-hydroxylating ferredoxin subunit